MDDSDDLPPSPGRAEEQTDWLPVDLDSQAHFASETVNEVLPPLAIPHRAEPTLKERLVERERQARVETERARLKRQFALSMNGGAEEDDLQKENGSVAGTLGEDCSVAAAPSAEQEDINEDDRKELGYVMERFLQQRDGVDADHQDEKPKAEPGVLMERFLAEPVVIMEQQDADKEIMEEDLKIAAEADILQEILHSEVEENTVLPLPPLLHSTNVVRSHDESELEATGGSVRSYSTVTNASLAPVSTMDGDAHLELPGTVSSSVDEHQTGDTDILRERDSSSQGQITSVHSTQGSVSDEPRVFRLTEAEIQEMAAIEEASIGNAPPSEREETLSESSVNDLVGDLLGDFGSPRGLDRVGDFSERTNTTALESASITSVDGDLSERPSTLEMDRHSVDVIDERASVSSHLVVSPGASDDGSVSITACPPSVTAEEEQMLLGPDGDLTALPYHDRDGAAILEMLSSETGPPGGVTSNVASLNCAPSFQDDGGPLDVEAAAAANAGVTNRQLRPGKAALPPPILSTTEAGVSNLKQSAFSAQRVHIMLDDFDFDKHMIDPLMNTPNSGAIDSYNDLPGDDTWSPRGEMNLSPLRPDRTCSSSDRVAAALQYPCLDILPPRLEVASGDGERGTAVAYGSTEFQGLGIPQSTFAPPDHVSFDFRGYAENIGNEAQPLIHRQKGEGHVPARPELRHMVSNVFRSIRSDSDTPVVEANTDSEKYLSFGIVSRAFPERFFALLVTLVVEIPVLLMISGGSDRLCMLIGRRRYQLMMGFLPLSSAISGNVGLQASTVTTRAISHDHVTKKSYIVWLAKEIAAAACLGVGMGCVLGAYAFFASGKDYAFALTIFTAQFVSIVTAGLTGTLAPLMFTFIFRRDSALYGGPLETAIQDIVGSFAMVVLSYQLLLFFGPTEISPDDICGSGGD